MLVVLVSSFPCVQIRFETLSFFAPLDVASGEVLTTSSENGHSEHCFKSNCSRRWWNTERRGIDFEWWTFEQEQEMNMADQTDRLLWQVPCTHFRESVRCPHVFLRTCELEWPSGVSETVPSSEETLTVKCDVSQTCWHHADHREKSREDDSCDRLCLSFTEGSCFQYRNWQTSRADWLINTTQSVCKKVETYTYCIIDSPASLISAQNIPCKTGKLSSRVSAGRKTRESDGEDWNYFWCLPRNTCCRFHCLLNLFEASGLESPSVSLPEGDPCHKKVFTPPGLQILRHLFSHHHWVSTPPPTPWSVQWMQTVAITVLHLSDYFSPSAQRTSGNCHLPPRVIFCNVQWRHAHEK